MWQVVEGGVLGDYRTIGEGPPPSPQVFQSSPSPVYPVYNPSSNNNLSSRNGGFQRRILTAGSTNSSATNADSSEKDIYWVLDNIATSFIKPDHHGPSESSNVLESHYLYPYPVTHVPNVIVDPAGVAPGAIPHFGNPYYDQTGANSIIPLGVPVPVPVVEIKEVVEEPEYLGLVVVALVYL